MNDTQTSRHRRLLRSIRPLAVIGAAWFIGINIVGCGSSPPPAAPTAAVGAPAVPVTASSETVQMALSKANAAFRANRMVEPAGDNALEHALRALQLEPDNAGANEILVDITPIAASAIEADIAAGDFTEAERVMALLSSANPDSMIVQNLQRRLTTAIQKVAPPPAVAVVAAAPTPTKPVREIATAAVPSQTVAAPSAPIAAGEAPRPPVPATTPAAADSDGAPAAAVARTPEPTPPAPAAAVTVTDPVAVSKVSPEYPPAARKRRAEGWVELQFMVGVDGVPRQIEVLRAQPAGLFDRSAVRALSRWKFRPGQRDGRDVEARARTTINFKLS